MASRAYSLDLNIDPKHSAVSFKIKHLGISTVSGKFDTFTGTVQMEPGKLETLKATAKIDANSIDTGVADRDKHLRSGEFFDVQKYPDITFASKEVRNVSGQQCECVGDLTMHGVTKPVTLNVEFGGLIKDPWGNQRAAFTATGTLNRKDFGLTWNKALETGSLMVGEDVKIILEIEAAEKK
ncbi:MAG: YceI family protein [Verrucomicrobiae bacterium]|nr:YceI family protein [Verrucomicrobiae bacterium]